MASLRKILLGFNLQPLIVKRIEALGAAKWFNEGTLPRFRIPIM
jgi:hypothetical protein